MNAYKTPYTRKNIFKQQKRNRYTQKLTGRKPDPRMFYHRLQKSMAANAAYQARTAAPAPPAYATIPMMSAIPEESSVRHAPYNRKAQFLASRRAKQMKAITGRKPSIFNTRRFSKRPVLQVNDPMLAAMIQKREEERAAKQTKRQKKAKAKAASAPPTRQSSRLAAKQTGAPVQHVALQNTPKKPRGKGPTKKQVNDFSNLFSGMKF
jgi:hypothetical protein